MKKIILIALFITASFLTSQAQYAKLLDFDSTNGSLPNSSLISDGTFLYGMTTYGGTDDIGALFKIKPDGTGYVKLLDFAGAVNGSNPWGSLFFDGTFLYGMTTYGGTNDMGVIFKIKPDGTGYVKLLDFTGVANGSGGYGSLISDGTFLYGMTGVGGTNDAGTIFKIKPDGTGYVKLLDFTDAGNGRNPFNSLISDGTFLYGTTSLGGTNGYGNMFKIKPDGTGYVKLLDFAGANGSGAGGSIISDGIFLYGTTEYGGTNNYGVIFKIKPDGTGYSKLLDFDSTNGGAPRRGALISDGTFLYGMTYAGGTNNMGVIFKIKPDGNGYSKLYDFADTTIGYGPMGSLISDGTFLYGMTTFGGTTGHGTIFKYALATGIAEHPAKGGFNVYPNPTSGIFTIEKDDKQRVKGEAEIYNVMGEKVYETTISEPSALISLNVPGGIYFIHIITELGTASRKMVVRH